MLPLKTYILLYFLIVCFGCKQKAHVNSHKLFSVEKQYLKGDANLISAAYFKGKIFCLKEDSTLIVLDTFLKADEPLTSRYSGMKIHFLLPINDTIFLGTDKGVFLLDTGFALQTSTCMLYKYGLPYLDDSLFYVYSCSRGEWGGSVFFLDKKTNKTYYYPTTCAQQLLKFKASYIVSNHLGGSSDYLSINDPTKLYELNDEKQKRSCDNYTIFQSLKPKKQASISAERAVKYYADTFMTRTLTTFSFNDELYSIYATDSATILAKHKDFKLIPVDTLLNNSINFHDASTHLVGNIFVTAYRASWGVVDGNDKRINHKNSGLVFMQNNAIKFLEFNSR